MSMSSTKDGEAEGETIIRKRERFSHELTLAYESGQIIELKETKEAKPGDEKRSCRVRKSLEEEELMMS